MSKFEELQKKVSQVNKEELTNVIKEVGSALDDGNIDEKGKTALVKLAKERLGEPFSGYNI